MFFTNKVFKIKIKGLKPQTQHDFYFENIKRNQDCVPNGGDLGDDLITDNRGRLDFDFHYTNSTELSWINSVGGLKKWTKRHLPPTLLQSTTQGIQGRDVNIEVKQDNSIAKGILTVKSIVKYVRTGDPSTTDTGP